VETEILNMDYNRYVSLVGTAHFTRRSLMDAYDAVQRLKPTDLAIELDMERFQLLNHRCSLCPRQTECPGRCEFVGATDALGNVDANIWLIDMTEMEIKQRIRRLQAPSRWWRFSRVSVPPWPLDNDNEVRLWENGRKDEVLKRYAQRLKVLRARAPHVWHVLIDERNALMAARLAWIVTQKLAKEKEIRVLALTGAAHVGAIRALLTSPTMIRHELQRLGLRFSAPRLIKRVSVN
jgi:pheromone shutdown protein TraB